MKLQAAGEFFDTGGSYPYHITTYEASFSLPSLAHRLSVLKAVQRLTQYARLDVLLQLELRCVRRLVPALLDAQLHTTCQSVCAAAAFAPMP